MDHILEQRWLALEGMLHVCACVFLSFACVSLCREESPVLLSNVSLPSGELVPWSLE